MSIKFLPGLLSYFHVLEFFTYCLIGALCFIPNIFLVGIFVAVLFCVVIFRIYYFIEQNGSELFIKINKQKMYVFRDLFFYKSCLLNENTIIYKTKVIGIEHGFNISRVKPGKPTSDKDGLSRQDAFIIFTDGNLGDYNFQFKYDSKGRLISCKENFHITYKLLKSKKLIMLSGNKSNYNFLRQYVKEEQFCGLTEIDNIYLNELEQLFKVKLNRKVK